MTLHNIFIVGDMFIGIWKMSSCSLSMHGDNVRTDMKYGHLALH
jgi:hypothetical protein